MLQGWVDSSLAPKYKALRRLNANVNRKSRKIFQRIVPPTGVDSRLRWAVFAWVASLLLTSNALAVTNNVASIAALQTAIDGAAAGDVIVLANGTYLNSAFDIRTSGITVRAGTPGGVFLNGTVAITIPGSRVIFSGFQFTSGTISGIPIQVTGSQNLLTQLNFDGYSAQKYINIQAPSRSNEVSYCHFRNKPASAPQGNLVHFGADETVVGYPQDPVLLLPGHARRRRRQRKRMHSPQQWRAIQLRRTNGG